MKSVMLKIRLNLRKVVAIAVCLAVSVTMFAQDIITLKDGTEIRASVLDVEGVDVKFKKFDNINGPSYLLAKSEIFMIKYADGTKDIFTSGQQTSTQQQRTVTTVQQQSTTVSQPVQTVQTRPAQWGVKGGLNGANGIINNEGTNSSIDGRTGLHVGALVEIPVSSKVGFQSELVYSMQGDGLKIDGETMMFKLDYINLPLMFKFYVGQQQRLSIDVGLQFGYMINGKVSALGVDVDFEDFFNFLGCEVNKFDVSLGLGMSYKLNNSFDLAWRANLGMTNVVETKGAEGEARNAVFQLGVAYRF